MRKSQVEKKMLIVNTRPLQSKCILLILHLLFMIPLLTPHSSLLTTHSTLHAQNSPLLTPNSTLKTYFPQTDYELNVYHIKGKEPGKTLMVIAAIQGDETAPYLAADLFVDIALRKGNLIIIPRANLPSLIANRRLINQDMNRRFAQENATIYEDEVVNVIKSYIAKSDLLLNLHEGGGFYRHTYEDADHNPMKYGQCLIADADSFYVATERKYINLKKIAETIIRRINHQIYIPQYTYRFNNHNTVSNDSPHLEQRKSATYYALTQAHIPAFGVEVSRQLPTETLKKEYMKLIINEFMYYLDIRVDIPPLYEQTPTLNYLLVKVNGEKRYLESDDILNINENATLQVTGISTNYPRGNYVDVIGFGNKNDLNKVFNINRNTEIYVYKDSHTIARIPVRIQRADRLTFEGFRVNILDDNSTVNVFAGDTLTVTQGAEFEILGSLNNDPNISIRVAGATITTKAGRQIIDTGTGLSDRFALNSAKNLYEIIISDRNQTIATSFLKIRPIQAFDLHISHNDKSIIMAPGDTLFVKYGDTLFIHDVTLNQLSSSKVKVNLAGYVLDPTKDAEDRGGTIYLTRDRLLPRYAVNPAQDLYEIHILYRQRRYAVYRIQVKS